MNERIEMRVSAEDEVTMKNETNTKEVTNTRSSYTLPDDAHTKKEQTQTNTTNSQVLNNIAWC